LHGEATSYMPLPCPGTRSSGGKRTSTQYHKKAAYTRRKCVSCDASLHHAHSLTNDSRLSRRSRTGLRNVQRDRFPPSNIRGASAATKARRIRHEILFCAGKGADEREDAGRTSHRLVLRAQELGTGRLWPGAYFPQSSLRSRAHVEKTHFRRGGVPRRVPRRRLRNRQQHGRCAVKRLLVRRRSLPERV
jgi:hypothetical protein